MQEAGSPSNYAAKSLRAVLLSIAALTWTVPAALPTAVTAQGLTGQISGRIQDASDRVVAGVDVILTSVDTSQTRVGKTQPDWGFPFPRSLPGKFEFRFSGEEFKKIEKKKDFPFFRRATGLE